MDALNNALKNKQLNGNMNTMKITLSKLGFGGKSRTQVLDEKIETTTQLQNSHLKIAGENTEISKQIVGESEQLRKLVSENNETKNILLQKENDLKTEEKSLEERAKEIRKQEIEIVARKSTVRTEESEVRQKDKGLDHEREDIKKRETKAKKDVDESNEIKEKFEEKNREFLNKEKELKELESYLKERKKVIASKERKAKIKFERAETIDEEIKEKESKFEERRAEIEQKLIEKIDEYDRKLADIEELEDISDAIKFDSSEEGVEAKIVVQDAIKRAKKLSEDNAKEFDELQDKYCKGTFKGFATPLSEMEESFEDLKTQLEDIREHANSNELTETVEEWISQIEDYFLTAEKSKKAWEFSSAYRFIIFGLATCKNYELLLKILNNWEASSEEENAEEEYYETDYYEILNVDENATEEEIKKAYRNLANKYHPDKAGNNEDQMKDINKAKEILLDERKKRDYDKNRKHRGV